MAANPRQTLHDLIERLSEEEARHLSAALLGAVANGTESKPRPLTEDDIVLTEPVLPDDETADEMIAEVRRWRSASGYA